MAGGIALSVLGAWIICQTLFGRMLERLRVVGT